MKNFYSLVFSAFLFLALFSCKKDSCHCERTVYSGTGSIISGPSNISCPSDITSQGQYVTTFTYNGFGDIETATETSMVCD